ncbi:flowering time control protein FY-like [Actinidia eriantha]|uniref:flowering time control protein FY-like n=1 Tax=Actinidia eriantha TaxID=165200 RepID=UPI002582B2E3|nr:flowering time control protein FY-like [Actinidia eriantha]
MDILDLYVLETCGRSICHAALLNWYNMKQELECFQKYWEYSFYGEENPALAGLMPDNFPRLEPPTTPEPFAAGLARNDETIPGVGIAMPLSIPSLDTSAQGDQRPPLAVSMPSGAPPLPPGPHPSLLAGNQQQAYQQNAQQIQHHQPYPQQMTSLPMPRPYLPQLQPPSNPPLLSHPHLPRPPPQLNHLGMPSNMLSSMPMPILMSMPGQMCVQGAMNQMVPPFQQGHFMGISPMQSGSTPPVRGIPSGLPNNQGPSNINGTKMYPLSGAFNLPQVGPMPLMPGFNPYQSGNPNATGMGTMPSAFFLPSGMPPPLPLVPPPHGQSTQ